MKLVVEEGINLCKVGDIKVGISFDECICWLMIEVVWCVFGIECKDDDLIYWYLIFELLVCISGYLDYLIFYMNCVEIEMMWYMCCLFDCDLVLDCVMILLGLCMMKLNVVVEMMLIIWLEFVFMYLFVLLDQVGGYQEMIDDLIIKLCDIIGYDDMLMQLNLGVQGEYVGLLIIMVYYVVNGDDQCDICLIFVSVYGINFVLVQMCGMKVVVVKLVENGDIDVVDFCVKVEVVGDWLVVCMIIYFLIYGVFEEIVCEVCEIMYEFGGQVYIDGVNLNVMVGIVKLGDVGGDVSYLNLYKIFVILYGGGGFGMGLIGVKVYFVFYLFGYLEIGGIIGLVLVVLWGSVLILLILWVYILLMGGQGLMQVIKVVILNGNYIVKCLEVVYDILFKGKNGFVVYECIFDICLFVDSVYVLVDDIVKCLVDNGFYVLIMSWLVVGMLMVELIELEIKVELD